MGLSSLLVGLEVSISISISWVLEEDHGVLLVTEDGLDLVLRELENSWNHKWLDEIHERVLVWLTWVNMDIFTLSILFMVLILLERLEISEENNLWLVVSDLNISEASEWEVNEVDLVLGIGVWDMSLGVEVVVGWAIVSNEEFVILIQSWQFGLHAKLELILSFSEDGLISRSGGESVVFAEVLVLEVSALKLRGWWSGLLGNPLDDGILGSSTSILRLDTVPKRKKIVVSFLKIFNFLDKIEPFNQY